MEIRRRENIYRPDMIDILMQVREGTVQPNSDGKITASPNGSATNKAEVPIWSDYELVAQCFLFFVAGFDSSSTALAFAAYELVANPQIQQRLYEECATTNTRLNGDVITYDELQKMTYLDQFVSEVLRHWPANIRLDRQCIKDYVVDDGNGLRFHVDKGRSVIIPVYGIHHDPKYFDEPHIFNPERFSNENKRKITPGTYIPFGVGPRNCIGMSLDDSVIFQIFRKIGEKNVIFFYCFHQVRVSH